jgi:hypothetical protein
MKERISAETRTHQGNSSGYVFVSSVRMRKMEKKGYFLCQPKGYKSCIWFEEKCRKDIAKKCDSF